MHKRVLCVSHALAHIFEHVHIYVCMIMYVFVHYVHMYVYKLMYLCMFMYYKHNIVYMSTILLYYHHIHKTQSQKHIN